MANIYVLGASDEILLERMRRSVQSGHLNFLLGSGASFPAIPIAGPIEIQIEELIKRGMNDQATDDLYRFVSTTIVPTNKLIARANDANNTEVINSYKQLLLNIETLLNNRRTALLPKQASIFTTNYDLYIEEASTSVPGLKVNDGFSRGPRLDGRSHFSSRVFFDTIFNTGNLYNYRVEIPTVNLLKIHGSLSWARIDDQVEFSGAQWELLPVGASIPNKIGFLSKLALVLPHVQKFQTTVMERNHYELLRILSNELDRENAVLFVFGFSFGDIHIQEIVKRALKNPTLRVNVFAFDEKAALDLESKFEGHGVVDIVRPAPGAKVDFAQFNDVIAQSCRLGTSK